MTRLVGYLVAGLTAVAAFFAWLAGRRKRALETAEAAAKHNDRRADEAEAVAVEVIAGETERRTSLEEEIREDAQARIDAGAGGARRRVQDRWAAAGASHPAGDAPAVPARTAGGTGSNPAIRAPVRGRR